MMSSYTGFQWLLRSNLVAGMLLLGSGVMAAELAPTIELVRQRLESGEPTRIVCFGDSITGAYYHTGGQRAWCDMLGIALQRVFPNAQVTMVNAGISGHTTADGLARIQKDVLDKQPHLVVVMFGMNDVTRLPLGEFGSNLQTIAQKCLDAGAAVVLCTPNSVHENPSRPNSKLAELSEFVLRTAKDMSLPASDCFADFRMRREQDETAWMLLMSDDIHPNMRGHRRMAELIAQTVSGHRVQLDSVPPLADALHHTMARIEAGETVHLVAMPPYDQWMAAALIDRFPQAKGKIRITTWPTESQSLHDLSRWGAGVRELKPDLVVPAVPASVTTDSASFIRDYEWVLNWSFPFAGRAWDVVPVIPAISSAKNTDQLKNARLARQIVLGKDVRFLEHSNNDATTASNVLSAWIAEQEQTRPNPPVVSYSEHQDLSYYLDRNGNRHPIRTGADWQMRRRHLLDNVQRVMGPLPGASFRVPLAMTVLEEVRESKFVRRRISFQSDPFDRVTAWLLLPSATDRKPRPAVLCLHQTTGEGKNEPIGLAGSPNMHYGRELAERGYVVLAPDYPSLGEHSYEFAQHPEFVSGSMKAIWDNLRAVDLLAGMPEVAPERIGVIGHSLGAHNALFTALFEPRLKVVVSSCGFTSLLKDDLPSWTGPRYMPRIASEFGNDVSRMPFDFSEVLAGIAPRPLLVCAATGDRDFDIGGVRDVIASVQPVYSLLGMPQHLQTEYPDSPHDFPVASRQRTYEFLDRYLRP